MTYIINLLGGPCSGKSRVSGSLFDLMKWNGDEVELVQEFAKELVWEGALNRLTDQGWIFEEQNRRQNRLRGKVDYVITDSPIALSMIYGRIYNYHESFFPYVRDVHKSYENINIFLRRVKEYNPKGRTQTEEEAKQIDLVTLDLLYELNEPYFEVTANRDAAQHIYNIIKTNYEV